MIFQKNVLKIRSHNKKKGTYEMGINKFVDLTDK